MRDYTALYSDILFYTKEHERVIRELKDPSLSDNARLRLTLECKRIKEKLDALVEKIPEISENPAKNG